MLGLADNAVGISENAQYEALVPAEVRAEIEELKAKFISGELTI